MLLHAAAGVGGHIIAGGFHEEEHGQGQLALLVICAQGLAGGVIAAGQVEAVIVNLVGDTQQGTHAVELLNHLIIQPLEEGCPRHGHGKEGGRLLADKLVVICAAHVDIPQAGGLLHLALAEVAHTGGHAADEAGIADFRPHHHGLGQHGIPQQHSQFIAPQGIRGGLVAAGLCLIQHIIMHQ